MQDVDNRDTFAHKKTTKTIIVASVQQAKTLGRIFRRARTRRSARALRHGLRYTHKPTLRRTCRHANTRSNTHARDTQEKI